MGGVVDPAWKCFIPERLWIVLRMGCREGILCLEDRDGSCKTLWLKDVTIHYSCLQRNFRPCVFSTCYHSDSSDAFTGLCLFGNAPLKVGLILKMMYNDEGITSELSHHLNRQETQMETFS
ncbi:hypothetical protein KC19_3G165200 [Ceratodon purpureus]|uniref:Uncharacterized protein n=1 Tax=Ceratodon purpureus TaxID=3225 RepID=A0A8T0ILQ9_CERPU|nr:hypothetical protein KC19_3G165200 [Ceratodon purpureus]